ncbi:MAG TPA: hypothetical protein VGJ50_05430 [Streptosporangiaceae bacterium]
MTTTVSSGTRQGPRGTQAPRRQPPRREDQRDPRRSDPRHSDPRRSDPGRPDPREPGAGRAAAGDTLARGPRTARPTRKDSPLRTARPARTVRPARPARPTGPAAPSRPARPAVPGRLSRSAASHGTAGTAERRAARTVAAGRRASSRTPFVLLVLGMLAGGLICLLVINTTLAAGSIRITDLQHSNLVAAQRVQELQQQVATDQSASAIARRAYRLGLRTQPKLDFVDLRTGRSYSTPNQTPGVYAVPGYTP